MGGRVSAGGAAPKPGDECTLPPEVGSCAAAFSAYYHDAATGVCRPFVYGGCGGNVNRYPSLEACQLACPDHGPNYDGCETAADCVVVAAGCCGACEQVSAAAFLAVHQDHVMDVNGDCAVACGACPALPAHLVPTAGNYLAACIQGECRVLDVRQTEAAECESDADCELRDGSRCCQGCGGNPVAVSDEQALQNLLECPTDLACPPCEPTFEPAHRAVCRDEYCIVEVTP
jgi:hypothetical protein